MTADAILSEVAGKVGRTQFVGYDSVRLAKASVLTLVRNGKEVAEVEEGDCADMVLDVTPFYAESGGQIGDRGVVQVCTYTCLVGGRSNTPKHWECFSDVASNK